MESQLIMDFVIALLILLFFFGSKFNTWPEEKKELYSDKPSDYIDKVRYGSACLLYVFFYTLIAFAFYNTPELLTLLSSVLGASVEQLTAAALNHRSFMISAIVVVAAFSHRFFSKYDQELRDKLHAWALIPNYVQQLRQSIITANCYEPSAVYRQETRSEVKKLLEGRDSQQVEMDSAFQNLDAEKATDTLKWQFIKCLSLHLIVRKDCELVSRKAIEKHYARLKELAVLVSIKQEEETASLAGLSLKEELDRLSQSYIESICKQIVRNYTQKSRQYTVFHHYGFSIKQNDVVTTRLRDAVALCIVPIAAVAFLSSYSMLTIIDHRSPMDYFTNEKLFQWSSGGAVSMFLALIIAIVADYVFLKSSDKRPFNYLVTFIVATLVSFVFFAFARDLSQAVQNLSPARLILVSSFASLTFVVLASLASTNCDKKSLKLSAIKYGVNYGLVLMIWQISISSAFRWEETDMSSFSVFLMANEQKMLWVGLVGFLKGFFLGSIISFIVKSTVRKQLLQGMRENPRLEKAIPMKLLKGSEQAMISTKNLSKNGVKIYSPVVMEIGEQVKLKSPDKEIGELEGVVRWIKRRTFGANIIGIEFANGSLNLTHFMRKNFGDFYTN